jgi:hypothetical protein
MARFTLLSLAATFIAAPFVAYAAPLPLLRGTELVTRANATATDFPLQE